MKLDLRKVEKGAKETAGQKFTPIVGKVEAVIAGVETKTAKNGNEYLVVNLEVVSDPFKGREPRLYIFPTSTFKGKPFITRQFKTLLEATGLKAEDDSFDEQALVGKVVIAYLTERDNNGTLYQDVSKFAKA